MAKPLLTIVVIREGLKISQTELADYLGWSQPWVSNLERGYCPKMSEETKAALQKKLGLPTEVLLMPYEDYLKEKLLNSKGED